MIEYATHIGTRPSQEDRIILDKTPEGILIGVADGHGGSEVADILEHHVERWWRAIDGNSYLKALRYVFEMAQASVWAYPAGSTLSLAFIQADQKLAHIGVVGDSPVIAERLRGDMFVAPEHNVRSNMEERGRAIGRGGIYYSGYIWNGIGDNAKGLQMSRALGDVGMGDILSHEPALMTVSLGDFLLVASDGLIDPKHTQRDPNNWATFDRVKAGMGTKALVDEAVALPTNDNATAVLWRRS